MFHPTHKHADGGLYRYIMPQSGKSRDSDVWMSGVCYMGEDGHYRWTDQERWDERFEPLPEFDGKTQDIPINEAGDVVTLSFRKTEADDIHYMLVQAAGFADKRTGDSYIGRVIRSMAEQVGQGLHIRHDFPDMIGDVHAFHQKFKQVDEENYGKTKALHPDLFDFRVKFHEEETHEYRDEQLKLWDAIERRDIRDCINSLELQLDALCDAAWVILGTADLQFGRDKFVAAWRRVVIANMAKVLATEDASAVDSGRDVRYDVRKPKGWIAPDHRDLVQDFELPALEYVPTAQ